MSEPATVSYFGAHPFHPQPRRLSNPETSRRGNLYGMIGMTIAVLATVLGPRVTRPACLDRRRHGRCGAVRTLCRAHRADDADAGAGRADAQPGRPRGLLVGFASYIDTRVALPGAEKTIHEVEIYVGILIGAVTFSGSLIAFGKLSGKIGGKPMLLPGRHWLNLAGLLAVLWFGGRFIAAASIADGMTPLIVMTVIALLFGIHMVMAIGGADMPVVVSMLNSYSGWAAAATGFMLSNDLLIVTGALVGSSGAILSYIMCRAMNRNFISVIAGGFGTGGGAPAAAGRCGARRARWSDQRARHAELLRDARA
jgi:NAD(P) transhydrogenase subunit beta